MRTILLSSLVFAAFVARPVSAQGLRGDIHAGVDGLHSDGDTSTGATFGLSLGYDVVRTGALIGVQLDLDASDNDGCERDVIVAGDQACVEARRDTALSLRLGGAVAASMTIYATAGYANAEFAGRYELAGVSASDHETLDGIRLGAGVSIDLTRRLYGKLEYRYTNYEQGVSRNQGLLGVGLRF